MSMELPLSYIEAPPTPQMRLFLLAYVSCMAVDLWIDMKQQAIDEATTRLGSVGGVGMQGTAKDLAHQRLQRACR